MEDETLVLEFEAQQTVRKTLPAEMLDLTIRRATGDTGSQVVVTMAAFKDGQVDRTVNVKQYVIQDPTATLLRTAILESKLDGDSAQALGVKGLTIRQAGKKILKQLGGG